MRVWRVVGLLGLVLACDSQSPSAPVASAAAPRTPEDVDRLFGERLNAGDVDGVVALYEPSATLVRQDGTNAVGAEAIRAEIAALAAQKAHVTMNVINTIPGGADVAVLYNDWIATAIDSSGKPATLSGRAVEVVRRQADGTWRFVVDAPNARSAP